MERVLAFIRKVGTWAECRDIETGAIFGEVSSVTVEFLS